MEEWRDVIGYEGIYKISSLGVLMSLDRLRWNGIKMAKLKGRLITGTTRKGAPYKIVNLSKNGSTTKEYMHRLVAMAFLPNPTIKRTVNHIDGNPANNCKDNLEWCSYSENHVHAYRVLKRKHSKAMTGKVGVLHPLSIPVLQIKNGEVIAVHESLRQAALSLGISSGNLTACCHDQNRKLKGFNWKYKNKENDINSITNSPKA